MISTITLTVTDSILSPVVSLSVIGTIILIISLIISELSNSCDTDKSRYLSQYILIIVIPLLYVFTLIVIFSTIEIL